MRRAALERGRLATIAVLAGAMALLAALGGCGGAADFERGELDDVRAALKDAGLEVCEERGAEPPPGAIVSEAYAVALDCEAGEPETVVDVAAWESEGARDEAVRRAESQGRRGQPVPAWTYGELVITVPGAPDDAARERVSQAMADLGAR